MLFRSLGLGGAAGARDMLQAIWPTTAAPAHFAPPVEAREDDEALVLVFDVAGWPRERLEVVVEDQALRVIGVSPSSDASPPRRSQRTFVLHSGIRVATTESTFAEGTLTVRVIKQPPGPSTAIVVRSK